LAICPNDFSLDSTPVLRSIRGAAIWLNSLKLKMQNKFSFGPSPEDQGRKKTVHSIEGGSRTPNRASEILAQSSNNGTGRATYSLLG